MNLGKLLKNEIVEKKYKEIHCQKAFISGVIRGCGIIYQVDGEIGLEFSVSGEDASIFIANCFSSAYDYEFREISVAEDKLNKVDKFTMSILGEVAINVLNDLGVAFFNGDKIEVLTSLPDFIYKNECCGKAFIKGLFLCCGSLTVPSSADDRKTGYHLQMVFSSPEMASLINGFLLKKGINSKVTRRREKFVLYVKSAEEIKDFIAYVSAPKTALKITDLIINREFVNDVNRRKNCDLGNVSRQLDATFKQIEAINKIKNKIGFDGLSKDLKETAEFRLKYDGDSLIELAEKLSITKSCINHRFRKLINIAKELED